jgi:uroporphyrinogen-III synthase
MRELRVLVTRPREQAEPLSELVTRAGMAAVAVPALEIVPLAGPGDLGGRIGAVHYDWVVFISVNAVRFGLAALGTLNSERRPQFAAVGAATARALAAAGATVDAVPADGASSEALLRLPAMREVRDRRVLIVRGAGGRETLARTLRARGAEVDYVECYKRVPCAASAPALIAQLADPAGLIATATSTDILDALIALAGPAADTLRSLPLAVMAPRIASAALRSGWRGPVVTARAPSDEALVAAVRWLHPCA